MYLTNNFMHDMTVLLICYSYVIATIMIPITLKKKGKVSSFTARKMVHLLAGLVVLLVPFFTFPIGRLWAVLIAMSLTLIVYKSEKGSKVKMLNDLYQSIGEDAEDKLKRAYLQGPFHYCVSITLLVTIFAIVGLWGIDQMYFAISGILIMIISDTLASIVGKKYGKRKITLSWTGTTRSFEGSSVFFITAFFLSFSSLFFFGFLLTSTLTLPAVIIYPMIIAAIGTLIELFSPSTWDDLTVPIITTLLFFVLVTFTII